MNPNEATIHKFYSAFQKKDYKTMQECYGESALFSDAVFQNLNAAQVKAMWEMLCKNAKDFKLEFKNVSANEREGQAEWTAWYTFSVTGNKIENHIKASFEFENGKIVKHTDSFSFYRWAKQALGLTGLFLGWTTFIKNKIRKAAVRNLENYMNKK
jgi:hypothetical protein